MRTLAILPVKSFERAKQRLQGELDPELRRQLAEAMLLDVLESLGASRVDEIVVVSGGARAREIAHEYGATAVEDRDQSHNAAAMLGVRAALALGAQRALLVPGDCPALEPMEIDELLARPVQVPSALIVPDRHGTGTNALLLTPPGALAPSFGPDSCPRHLAHARSAGVEAEVVRVPSLALDIDTPEDLAALASAPGRARRTRELLSRW
ncbi:MAG TPA: 2-phospho-L-lactate guanylyltransferase [Solirubrobacteraceae bacterium]|jgi:2-phospho-L-lactate guanylyltransferase